MDTIDTLQYYNNRIAAALAEYQDANQVDDLHRISKTRWKAALAYVYDLVFKPERKTRRGSALPYDNAELLSGIADLYIGICNEYEKDVSIYGFCILTGISYQAMLNWQNGQKGTLYYDMDTGRIIQGIGISAYKAVHQDARIKEMPNMAYRDIVKKLSASRQESLRSLSLDGSIPALALGKIEYGWIEGGLQQKQAELIEQSRAAAELLQEYKRGMIEEQKE